ncbi:acetyl-CoA/propionyl-CoA carboxylase [Blastomyces dermatitidis ATCC 26199]|nr:acetyl-CoA/propionyl-CoA carboxylase [Blastomyces dermatitidis ATCC 26199]
MKGNKDNSYSEKVPSGYAVWRGDARPSHRLQGLRSFNSGKDMVDEPLGDPTLYEYAANSAEFTYVASAASIARAMFAHLQVKTRAHTDCIPKVSHNATRGGIRLIGPKPRWARPHGGEGSAHPSNLIEYGYPMGTLNWTGHDPCVFPVDCPDFGGFVSSTTIVKADYWRMGQMKAGASIKYRRVTLEDALSLRRRVEDFVGRVAACCSGKARFAEISPLDYSNLPEPKDSAQCPKAIIIHQIPENGKTQPLVSYRQGGDDYVLIDYGHALSLYYDGLKIPQRKLIDYLCELEVELGDLSQAKMTSRSVFKLPLTFVETQRPYASYLPDNMDFVAENNAFTREQFENIYLTASFMRMNCPKMNPSRRVFTPEGQVSWGGSCMALFTEKPWSYEDFDQISSYKVTEEEYERGMAQFRSGRYEYKWEHVEFDMAEHNRLLGGTKDEVAKIRATAASAVGNA